MSILDIIAHANRNLLRSKLRTLLTILAIFVGGFTLTLTTGLNTGASEYLDRQLGNVSVPGVFQVVPKTDINPLQSDGVQEYNPNKKQTSVADFLNSSFTHNDIAKLAKVDGVDKAQPLYNVGIDYITRADGSSKKYTVRQFVQNFGLNLDLAAGRLLKDDDSQSVVLPEDYLEPLGFASAQDAIGASLTIAYHDFRQQPVTQQVTIVGVMNKTFLTSGQLYASFDVVEKSAKDQGQLARFFGGLVRFKDATDQTDEQVLKNRLQEAGNYSALSVKERIGTVVTIVGAITAGLNVIGIIALFAASFGIINTLFMSVYERTQEIGLMKALGMGRARVFTLFAIEAALVGFWGSVVAVGAAVFASGFVNQWASTTFLKDFPGFTLLVVNPFNALIVVAVIMAIAFLAGTLPALKASRLNPIDALRSE
ncbi:MAG TPA: ABC transporter permease [Candidatus Saccharimonadales bacterium]|nr:ABC transporter permease [Candidatus Saccharimonadales bacterium]